MRGGGIVLRDINGTAHQYGLQLIVLDDNSTVTGHRDAVTALLEDYAVHFVLGASPAFTDMETVQVQSAGRLNFHCCSSAPSVYSRDQKNVFGERAGIAGCFLAIYSVDRT
jgi:hypothetical protein